MSRAFTRLGKEIAIAVKLGGPDPDANPRLRTAMHMAKVANMPKDNVENAIKRASSKDAADLADVNYEGYAPHGVAVWVEAATDNPTRTVANIRSYFNKIGGSLGTSGSLEFIFIRKGVFNLPLNDVPEQLELTLIENGAEDIVVSDGEVSVFTSFADFSGMQKALEAAAIAVTSAELRRIPNTTVALNDEQADDVIKLIERIEEDDDVQNVFHNMSED